MIRKSFTPCLVIFTCLTVLILAVPPIPAAAQEGGQRLVVAWIAARNMSAGGLFAWRSGDPTPRMLADDANRLFLSPDGEHVAFTRGEEGYSESLWVVGLNGGEAVEWVGSAALNADPDPEGGEREIARVAWLDAQTILWNTAMVYTYAGFKNDDLWRADLTTGETAQLFPDGQGGDFTISPDGRLIALVTPGWYGQELGTIRLIDPQGEPIGVPFTFEAVSTASEYAFYPAVYWLPDSSAIRVAMPHPDLIYGPSEGAIPPTALWELRTDGTAAQIGAVDATFFGQPRWSPDGVWLTYMRQVGPATDNTHEIVLARGDGSDPQVIRTGAIGALEPPTWTPDGHYFFTADAPGEMWLGAPDVAPERFPSPDERAFSLVTLAGACIYATAMAGPLELRYAALDAPSPITIATIAEGFPVLDALDASPS